MLVTTNPPFLPHLAWFVNHVRGVPYVLLFWDVYPDHLIHQGWLSPAGVIARVWQSANRKAMSHAALVIAIGKQMAESLKKQGAHVPIALIPNWADTESIRPIPKDENPFAVVHNQVGKITVMYSGNIGKTHGVATLIEAAALLKKIPNLWFLVIGDGLGLSVSKETARRLNVENVTFLPMQDWEMVPYSLASCDIAVVLQEPGTESLSVPSKTYNFMAAGCLILAGTSKDSDLGRLIENTGIGVVAPPDDSSALANSIQLLIGDTFRFSRARHNARREALKNYSVEAIQNTFIDAFRGAGLLGK